MLSIEEIHKIAEENRKFLLCKVQEFEIKGRSFPFNSTPSLMGVVNLSPDSWYRESVCLDTQSAVQRGKTLFAEGADIVDVGAESTLGHAEKVDRNRQIQKLTPVVQELSATGNLISVETYDLQTAQACLSMGASVLNLTGNTSEVDFLRLIVEHDAGVILCYVEGENVRNVGDFHLEDDMIPRMYECFARKIEYATRLGVKRIFIDPGLGFYYRNLQDSSQRIRHQMRTFLNAFRLRKLGWPVCNALPHAFENFKDEVRTAEAFFGVLAVLGKTDLLRTHEIKKVRGVVDTMKEWAP